MPFRKSQHKPVQERAPIVESSIPIPVPRCLNRAREKKFSSLSTGTRSSASPLPSRRVTLQLSSAAAYGSAKKCRAYAQQARRLRNQAIPVGSFPALALVVARKRCRSHAVSSQLRGRIKLHSTAIQHLITPRIPVRSFRYPGDLSVFPNVADTCECEECLGRRTVGVWARIGQ